MDCALQNSTGQVHAFLLTPTHGRSDALEESATPETKVNETAGVTLPQNVRKLLGLGKPDFGKFKIGMMRPK